MLIVARGTVRLEKAFYVNKKRLNYVPDSFEVIAFEFFEN